MRMSLKGWNFDLASNIRKKVGGYWGIWGEDCFLKSLQDALTKYDV